MQDVAADADDILDQRLPLGVGNSGGCAEYLGGPGFMPVAAFGNRGVAAGGLCGTADSFDLLHQSGLVVLQLDDNLCLRLGGGLEGFFWQCRASRVMMLCATWSSPSNRCAAGISLDFSSISMCAKTRPASVSNACSNWAALRSVKLSKLRLSVFPSSDMVRRNGSVASFRRPAAWRRNACSTSCGLRP